MSKNIYKNSKLRKKGERFERILLKHKIYFLLVTDQENIKEKDMKCGLLKIQIKWDDTISKTNNLYYEIFEKSKPSQREWRNSPSDADIYIFGTRDNNKIKYYIVSVKTLKEIIKRKRLVEILPTSKGCLIPIKEIKHIKGEYPRKKLT